MYAKQKCRGLHNLYGVKIKTIRLRLKIIRITTQFSKKIL